jgi:hypothetical protein
MMDFLAREEIPLAHEAGDYRDRSLANDNCLALHV